MEVPKRREKLQWEYSVAILASRFVTVTIKHPLDLVQARFQAHDGRLFSQLPRYNDTAHAIFTIARLEGLKGLYAGFLVGALRSTITTALLRLYYVKAKQRHAMSSEEKFIPDLRWYMEAGALVCLCTNPFSVVKTRLQLQTPLHQARPYSGLYDAYRTIKSEEGFSAFFRGIVPGLFLVPYVAISFKTYTEIRKTIVDLKTKGSKVQNQNPDQIMNSVDFAVLGATSKLAVILPIYPFDVIRTRLQQRPDVYGIPRYRNSWHVVKETARFEGVRGFYKGIIPNLLINIPVASMSSIVYENVLKLLKPAKKND